MEFCQAGEVTTLLTAVSLEGSPADQPDRYHGPHVQQGCVFVDRGSRLSAAIALSAVEIQGGHGMLAVGAFEGRSAVKRFGGVISHVFSVVL
jgi:hypothetical protein